MDKMNYNELELEIIRFESEDIVTASPSCPDVGPCVLTGG